MAKELWEPKGCGQPLEGIEPPTSCGERQFGPDPYMFGEFNFDPKFCPACDKQEREYLIISIMGEGS